MTPANDNRPESYDAALLKHMRLCQKMAAKYDRQNREEFAQDLLTYLLDKWHHYNPTYAFSTWVHMSALSVHSGRYRAKNAACRSAPTVSMDADPDYQGKINAYTHEDPESVIDLANVIARLQGTRGGEMLLRRAMGDCLREIGAVHGISKERVRQIVQAERKKLQVGA